MVGAGAAGLYTALLAAREGTSVILISATALAESSTYWAQGGLAAALADGDSPALHLEGTLRAGRGAVRESAARVLCDEAPGAVEDLAALGVSFDADRHGRFALGLEGGHSARRIVHAGGAATGRRLRRQLSALVAEEPLIEVHEGRQQSSIVVVSDMLLVLPVLVRNAESLAASAAVLTFALTAGKPWDCNLQPVTRVRCSGHSTFIA